MEIPQTSARWESRNTEAACADKAVEYGGSAESDCARAMAQAERVLREVSLMAFCARRSAPELSSSVSENAESSQFLISRRSEGASIPIAPQRSWEASTCNPYPTTFR
jgi:hypothetical protein